MAVNQHQVVTFNDGEPLDPVKLNKLAQNIDTLYQMTSLSNQTNSSGNPATPLIFTKFFQWKDVKPGQMVKSTVPLSEVFDQDDIAAGRVFAVAGLRSHLDDKENVTVSISGITSSPTVYAVNNGAEKKTISVDVIAVTLKEIIG